MTTNEHEQNWTMEPLSEPESLDPAESAEPTTKPKRKRTSRKRSVFHKAPRPAWPVRGLWESAPEEQRREAHATCMLILEYWLGKRPKERVAEALGVKPLRVWQLSQMALSGMMAGLLPQPRTRVPKAVFEGRPEESPSALKKRIEALEKELKCTEDMVRVLQTAPWRTKDADSTPKGGRTRARKKAGKKRVDPAPRPDRSRAADPQRPVDPPGSGGRG